VQANKPGPRPKAPTTLPIAVSNALIYSSKCRRQVGGVNKAAAIKPFRSWRAHFNASESDSRDASSGSEGDRPPKLSRKRRRAKYSREKKL
jgi:hypothetical protein